MRHWLNHLIRAARIRLVDDSDVIQRVQVDEGPLGPDGGRRLIDKVKFIGMFGVASVPPIDAEVLVLGMGGDRSRSIAIASNHQTSRLKNLKPGDSGLYDVRGAKLTFTENGLLIDCAGLPAVIQNCPTLRLVATEKVTIDAPTTEITHDLTVGGTLTVAGDATLSGDVAIEGDTTTQGTITSAGAVTARAGGTAAELGAVRDAYVAHKHGAVKTGTDTSGVSDHLV